MKEKKISVFAISFRENLYLQLWTEENCIQEISQVGAGSDPDKNGDGTL